MEEERQKLEDARRKRDIFGDMFEEKKHVSYEYAARNDKKFDQLNRILRSEQERKSKIHNYAGFESLPRDRQNKEKNLELIGRIRAKEDRKVNRSYLEEQIKMKERQQKFEKDLELKAAKAMNDKARLELDQEVQKQEIDRKKRLHNKDELRHQIEERRVNDIIMNDHEKALNKDKLGSWD